MLHLIADACRERGLDHLLLTGQTRDRQELVDQFFKRVHPIPYQPELWHGSERHRRRQPNPPRLRRSSGRDQLHDCVYCTIGPVYRLLTSGHR